MDLQAVFLVVLLVALVAALAAGFPVAFTLGGVSLAVAALGWWAGAFDASLLETFPNRVFGIMGNATLLAIPLFVFMGVVLERSRLAAELLEAVGAAFGRARGGLAFGVLAVGALLAASTGIVGAAVVTMGLVSLPVMLRRGYDPRLAGGVIAAAGTLGQIIPPSIVLVLLADQLGSAWQQAQLRQGIFAPEAIGVADLFAGALLPGLGLVVLYALWVGWVAWRSPARAPALPAARDADGAAVGPGRLLRAALPVLALVLAVLGSILAGVASPTEAAAVGAAGAAALAALRGQLGPRALWDIALAALRITAMVFAILVGAAVLSLVFRGFGGDDLVHAALEAIPGGRTGQLLAVMALVFALGFVLDFIEIVVIVVPLVAPALLMQGVDPVWLGVMLAVNLQTSFLTPPFGFALFYLKGVAPPGFTTAALYRGVVPFIALQLLMLGLLALLPGLATWLPGALYG